jgi:hypothetical protein
MGTASQKVITLNNGRQTEVASIKDTAGGADADKLVATGANGFIDPSLLNATVQGAPNKIPQLGADGKLDASTMPTGIGADTSVLAASEALTAGDLVNVWNDGGTAKVRKADGSAVGKEAHGFVVANVASGANATVYFEGTNSQVTGLTPGVQYLSGTVPGKSGSAPATGSGKVVQNVGFATSPTTLNFNSGVPTTLA